jgi:hypothetical protein
MTAEFMMSCAPHSLHPRDFAGASYPAPTDRRFLLRKTALLVVVCGFLFLASLSQAQQADAMFGFGTVLSSGSTSCTVSSCFVPEKGGLYPSLSADVIFHKRVGFNFEAAWRASQGNYAGLGLPFRPILFTFNGMYQPRVNKKAGLDLMAGIGWQTTRFYGYTPTSSCVYFGACYTSSNHFLVDIGGGIRYYVRGNFFVRPEAHFYHIVNNTADFSSNNVVRVGASIGYTIGGPE